MIWPSCGFTPSFLPATRRLLFRRRGSHWTGRQELRLPTESRNRAPSFIQRDGETYDTSSSRGSTPRIQTPPALVCQSFEGKKRKEIWRIPLRGISKSDKTDQGGTLRGIPFRYGYAAEGKGDLQIVTALDERIGHAGYQSSMPVSDINCWFVGANGVTLEHENFQWRVNRRGWESPWYPITKAERKALGW